MRTVRGNSRVWRIAEWLAVSAGLSWLFLWGWFVTRRRHRPSPRSLRATTDGGAPA
jgi:hypothetical protein